jgi:hypothetical protein
VLLKAKMDWVAPNLTVDFKTFTQMRGKSIDRAVADAIFYEGYYRQAWLYSQIRKLQANPPRPHAFVIAFVESDPPHEVRIKKLMPTQDGAVSLYWERARIECREMIRRFADYHTRFGDKPWREESAVEPLIDEDMPQLAYAG